MDLYVKIILIENEINEVNEEYFKVVLHTQKLVEMIENNRYLDIKEALLDLTVFDLKKCLKNNEKLSYRFTKYGVETPTEVYDIEYTILDEIRNKIIKELGL